MISNLKVTSKRGELTTQQLVVIIILILSFVVILFLLFRLNLGETSNKEICHNSVVMVGKGKGLVGELDCKTTYVCIFGGGDCEGFSSTIKIEAKTPEELVKAIQDEIDDCDWMFGEGEIDYVGFGERGILEKTTCAICSTIKFNGINEFDFDGQVIDTNEKYSIITGMKSGVAWGIGSKELFIGPNITKSSEINSFECDEFVHKA